MSGGLRVFMPQDEMGGMPPMPMDPMMGAMPPVDPMMGAGMMAPPPPQFPSTSPDALAMIVADALEAAASQDQQMLAMQQQQAAMAAQPIIDQMLAMSGGMGAGMGIGAAPLPPLDPAAAFGEAEGLPPLPIDDAMVA